MQTLKITFGYFYLSFLHIHRLWYYYMQLSKLEGFLRLEKKVIIDPEVAHENAQRHRQLFVTVGQL
jgi:hypothetical protein